MERLKSLSKNKKAQLGLDTVKAVMIAFLVLAIISVAVVLAVVNLRGVAENVDTVTVQMLNVTTETPVNFTGAYPTGTSLLRNCALSITFATNATADGEVVAAVNYTTSGCLILRTITPSEDHNNTLWNLSGSYTYSDPRTYDLERNVTVGVTSFFDNTTTIFAILIVVVIILAISIIIAVVSRFGGGSGGGVGGSGISGGGKEFGSDTVMGV